MKIAVAGTGYVGLSIATLLSQYHEVTAVDVIPEKVEKINNRISPIFQGIGPDLGIGAHYNSHLSVMSTIVGLRMPNCFLPIIKMLRTLCENLL
jgi:UDP-glucose 6-dehydrogenase